VLKFEFSVANFTSVYDEQLSCRLCYVCRIEEYWEPKTDGMDRFVGNLFMIVVYNSSYLFFVTYFVKVNNSIYCDSVLSHSCFQCYSCLKAQNITYVLN